jgi:hypothetical protein
MGTRIKTFVATGLPTDGRIYAGDLNLIQDDYADLVNFSQTIDLATLRVGDSSIQLLKYGAAEARVTAALRVDGILRGLGGLFAGTFTTAQRDAIVAGFRSYGLVIFNTDLNEWQINLGSDAVPSWQPIGGLTRGVNSLTTGLDLLLNAILRPAILTTAQRDALVAGRRPEGGFVYNSDTNGLELNIGTDAAPAWQRVGVPPVVTAGAPPSSPLAGDKYIQDTGIDLVELIWNDASGVWESQQIFVMEGAYSNVSAGTNVPIWTGIGGDQSFDLFIPLPFFKAYYDAGLRLQVRGSVRATGGPAHSLGVGVYTFNDGETSVTRIAGQTLINLPGTGAYKIEPNWQVFSSYDAFTDQHAHLLAEYTLASGNTSAIGVSVQARWIRP